MREVIDRIIKGPPRFPGIVENLPSFIRRKEPFRKMVNLNEIMQRTIELRAHDLKAKNIQVIKNLDPTLPLMLIDPHQMQHAFLNLIHNTEQTTFEAHKKGILSITTYKVGSKVRIQFSDNGPGTPKEHLTKIFTTSFTTRGDDNGIEFDLSISYGIIKEHGGEIWVESEVGKGTSYFIELSISTTKFEKDVKEKPIAQSVNEKEEKGLLIDDEAHIIDLLSKFLAMEGYPTEKVTDGRLALEKLGRNSYYFILCDIKIPEIDGMTLYQELKERKSPNLDKIIFITGDAISTDIQAFLKSAQRPYLSKPFELMDVKKTIQQLITNTQTRH